MDKIEFRIADGTKCQGYLFTWKGLSFGLTKNQSGSFNYWGVIELQTGCSVISKSSFTRKGAISDAIELLNSKGIQTIKKRLKEIFVERGNTTVKGKIKTAHCTSPDNRLKTLCGRIKNEFCLPLRYFKYAKEPCKKCLWLAKKKKASRHNAKSQILTRVSVCMSTKQIPIFFEVTNHERFKESKSMSATDC